MHSSTLFASLALAAAAQAQSYGSSVPQGTTAGFLEPTVYPSQDGDATCITGMVPVQAMTTMNTMLKMQPPTNQSMLTQSFVSQVSTGIGQMQMMQVMGSMTNVSGTYNISSTLCYPGSGINPSTVQILTHGIGFDHTYWNFQPGYSYVDVAARNGYTTFSYDRLGVGKSAKEDGLQVVQGTLEVGIAHSLIQGLRNGNFASTSFEKVVSVGHSFGSAITTGVASQYPQDIDAAVLTGFSANMTALPVFETGLGLQIAAQNNPTRFGTLGNAYLASGNINNLQFDFFHAPGFDPAILNLAEATKGTVTLGELLTMMSVAKPAMQFTGPIDVVNGEYDLPFCFGNCNAPTNQAEAVKPMLFPMASNSSTTYLAPMSGHGLNFHYSAAGAFAQIHTFLKDNQL